VRINKIRCNFIFIVFFIRKLEKLSEKSLSKTHLIKLNCDDGWVEDKAFDAMDVLRSDILPLGSVNCPTCNDIKGRSVINKLTIAS
jgi:hypothetical protein